MVTRAPGAAGDRRRGFVVTLALPAFVIALVFAFGDGPAPFVPFVPQVAPDGAPRTFEFGASPANAALAPTTSAPSPEPERENALAGACRVVEVRDALGAPVAGVQITVFDGDVVHAKAATDAMGAVQLANAIDPMVGANWRIAVVVPALVVLQPLFPLTHGATTVVTIDELGWLDVTVLGATAETALSLVADAVVLPTTGVTVDEWRSVENVDGRRLARGSATGVLRISRRNEPFEVPWPGSGNDVTLHRVAGAVGSWRIPVPPMPAEWSIAAREGRWTASVLVAGPTRSGAVAPVVLDVRRCTLSGRVDAASRDHPTDGAWSQERVTGEFAARGDGTFAFDVWRNRPTRVTLANERAYLAWTVPPIDAETFDLGAIVLPPRPLLGTIDLRDERGERVHLLPTSVDAVEWDAPEPPGPRSAAVRLRAGELGADVLGAPGVVAAKVRFAQRGFFFDPEAVRVANGATVRVACVRAARLVVHVEGAQDLVTLHLRDDLRQESTRVTDVGVDATGQHHDFRNVRPGRHRIVGVGVPPGTFVELGAGQERDVRITVQRK